MSNVDDVKDFHERNRKYLEEQGILEPAWMGERRRMLARLDNPNPPRCDCHSCTQLRGNPLVAVNPELTDPRFREVFPKQIIDVDAFVQAERERCAKIAGDQLEAYSLALEEAQLTHCVSAIVSRIRSGK